MEVVFEVVKIEDKNILLKDKDGQEIIWPKNKAPKDISLGTILSFLISDQEIALAKRNQKAKDILNEILNV
jgi:hypothetical protein